ncbi:hypothetical protein [Lentimicrobium sp. S6]|uniref:hypothetical protein n=1 Tax=Lentimicrobium sp. S6 TaxID=2735872 RepID=UPI001554DACD|nr:hypothetical protein [Lentimicrobium sp. S6]NPD47053.1 hypothetical protein [Lentimicrobium sp. S6]
MNNKDKTTKNYFFGLFQNVKQTYNQFFRQNFDINEEYFEKMHQKHYTSDFKAKYIPDLYVETTAENEILESIFIEDKIKSYNNSLRNLGDWFNNFKKEYKELQNEVEKLGLSINKQSKIHKQLELLKRLIEKQGNKIAENKSNPNGLIIETIDFDQRGLEIPSHYVTEKKEYLDSTLINNYYVEVVFRRLTEIIQELKTLNILTEQLSHRVFVVHGNAGLGKSNLSARLVDRLIDKKNNIVLIRGKKFSGESTDLNELLLKLLDIPQGYNLSEILEKLNLYAKGKSIRIPIVIDALNETIQSNLGFSNIWNFHLNDLIDNIVNYDNLILVFTLRTSYLDRVEINYRSCKLIELKGFYNAKLEEAISKYFNYYNIIYDSVSHSDIFYFRTPLLLDLYCQMSKSDGNKPVKAKLGLSGFNQVFEDYIDKLVKKIKIDCQLLTVNKVLDGFETCSSKYLNQLGDAIIIEEFISSFDEDKKEFSQSVAFKVLEEYLIYNQDSVDNRDVIIHTQQEVGGYMLARLLIKQHRTINNIVNSDFFQKNLVGTFDKQHQLRDDILKFIIAESIKQGDLITKYKEADKFKELLLTKFLREPKNAITSEYKSSILNKYQSKNELFTLLNESSSLLLDTESSINIINTIEAISKLDLFNFNLVWPRYVFENIHRIFDTCDFISLKLNEESQLKQLNDSQQLMLNYCVWLLETTNRQLRDKATQVLLDFYANYPLLLLERILEFSNLKYLYIYERLSGILYGICLRLQNNNYFIDNQLEDIANTVFNLQFSTQPKSPSYHYIVIDNFRHIIDLAIYKKVFNIKLEKTSLKEKFHFNAKNLKWNNATQDDINLVAPGVVNWHTSSPDPLGNDFITYTINRLSQEHEGSQEHINNTTEIYKRIIDSGFIPRDKFKTDNHQEKDFLSGYDRPNSFGKTDRLGKKYSWNAFFEFAGKLLIENRLQVYFEKDSYHSEHYERLSDVEIEVSFPKKENIYLEKPLFNENLIEHKSNKPEWTNIQKQESIMQIWEQQFNNRDFTLLNGLLINKPDTSYNAESFLLIDSVFVKRNNLDFTKLPEENLSWDEELFVNPTTISKVYFGELYWADTIPDEYYSKESIKINKIIEPTISIKNLLSNKRGFEGRKTVTEFKEIEFTPSVIDILWESNSEVFPNINCQVPNPNIGKYLNLSPDTENFCLIDTDGELAYKMTKFQSGKLNDQKLNYLRTDLLKKYLDDNDLTILYQVKQHSFDRMAGDGSGDFRGLRFFHKEVN